MTRGIKNTSFDSLQDYKGDELADKIYEEPIPIVPYPHKSKSVTPWGFVRDEPNLAEKVLNRYNLWHRNRRDAT